MKLGIVSHSKLLTVFIRENMTRGLFSSIEGIKVTHGKMWGNLVCLFEPEGEGDINNSSLMKLLTEYKIGRLLSLGIGRTVKPELDDGDVVVSSDAVLWQSDPQGKPFMDRTVVADPKLLDRVLNSFERYRTDEIGSRVVVGTMHSYPKGEPDGIDQGVRSEGTVQCWDKDSFYLAGYCDNIEIPWTLVRLIYNGDTAGDNISPVIKWDMAKKCFWIVKGVLENDKGSAISKRAR